MFPYQATLSLSIVLAKSPCAAFVLARTYLYLKSVFSACVMDLILPSMPFFKAHSLSVACVKSRPYLRTLTTLGFPIFIKGLDYLTILKKGFPILRAVLISALLLVVTPSYSHRLGTMLSYL